MADKTLPRMHVARPRWVRIADIGRAPGLTPDERIELLSAALTELGICMGLMMLHGADAGLARYMEMGGRVRQDADGQPWIEVRQ